MEFQSVRFEKAVQRVFVRLFAMTEEEFRARLESHKEGDISQILLETGALDTFELEGWNDWEGIEIIHPGSSSPPEQPLWDPAFRLIFVACEPVDAWSDNGTLEGVKGADDYQYSLAA